MEGKEGRGVGAFAYTLLHGTVGLDIDDISDTVGLQVRSESDHALLRKRSWSAI